MSDITNTNEGTSTIDLLQVEEGKCEESSTTETIKNGAKTVGSYLQRGWNMLKSGVSKANTKFKEAEIGRKTVEAANKVKESQFTQKVTAGARTAGTFVVEGAKKTGRAIKNGVDRIIQKGEQKDSTVIHIKDKPRIFRVC